jgi:hypothetical protein
MVSWRELWSACTKALDEEAQKEQHQRLQFKFSDNAHTIACFLALTIIAKDLQ